MASSIGLGLGLGRSLWGASISAETWSLGASYKNIWVNSILNKGNKCKDLTLKWVWIVWSTERRLMWLKHCEWNEGKSGRRWNWEENWVPDLIYCFGVWKELWSFILGWWRTSRRFWGQDFVLRDVLYVLKGLPGNCVETDQK